MWINNEYCPVLYLIDERVGLNGYNWLFLLLMGINIGNMLLLWQVQL